MATCADPTLHWRKGQLTTAAGATPCSSQSAWCRRSSAASLVVATLAAAWTKMPLAQSGSQASEGRANSGSEDASAARAPAWESPARLLLDLAQRATQP